MTDARADFPEIAAVVDHIRATHGADSIQRAWVEDDEGYVLAGRRPASERDVVYLEPEPVLAAAQAFRDRNNPALAIRGRKKR